MGRRFYGDLGLGRRDLIKAIGAAGVGFATAAACSAPNNQASAPATTTASAPAAPAAPAADPVVENRPDSFTMTPDQALQYLMDGHKRFSEGKPLHPRGNKTRVSDTAVDQFPFAAFLSCADSRVPVEEVFDQGIGDCFVCRVAGNIATDQEIGSLEFGTQVLGSKVLMVIGHERCGAVAASMGRIPLPENPGKIPSLVPLIAPAVKTVQDKLAKEGVAAVTNDLEETIQVNIKNQVANLKKSPILSKLEKDGQLKIVGAYYDLDTGAIKLLDEKKA